MIRNSLIFIYIVAVLLVAGFAHAESLPITSYSYNPALYQLRVTGYFANTCQSNPKVEVKSLQKEFGRELAYLHVISQVMPPTGTICAQVIWGSYDIVVDIRTLDLPASHDLSIKLENVIDGKESLIRTDLPYQIPGFESQSVQIDGTLVRMRQRANQVVPYAYGLQTSQGTIALDNPALDQDLEKYVHHPVRIGGIRHQDVALPDLNDQNPSRLLILTQAQTQFLPIVIMTGISTLPALR